MTASEPPVDQAQTLDELIEAAMAITYIEAPDDDV